MKATIAGFYFNKQTPEMTQEQKKAASIKKFKYALTGTADELAAYKASQKTANGDYYREENGKPLYFAGRTFGGLSFVAVQGEDGNIQDPVNEADEFVKMANDATPGSEMAKEWARLAVEAKMKEIRVIASIKNGVNLVEDATLDHI